MADIACRVAANYFVSRVVVIVFMGAAFIGFVVVCYPLPNISYQVMYALFASGLWEASYSDGFVLATGPV